MEQDGSKEAKEDSTQDGVNNCNADVVGNHKKSHLTSDPRNKRTKTREDF